jgi:hypothetical protein
MDLLESLEIRLPDRVGREEGWNFEKEHSILSKLREILRRGWEENTSSQEPEHTHTGIIENVAKLTNNKGVFPCNLHYHYHSGLTAVKAVGGHSGGRRGP